MLKILTLAIALLVLPAVSASGQDFDKGLAAAQRGDFATALREWTPLAEQGDADAQFNLGLMFGEGLGVAQDSIRALMWFTISASSGNETAAKGRDMVVKQATPAQIAKAQDLARECVAKNYKGC